MAMLTSKGQITIPADVRRDLKVDTGDRVEFIQIAPGRASLNSKGCSENRQKKFPSMT
eukprot:gene26559-33159_t